MSVRHHTKFSHSPDAGSGRGAADDAALALEVLPPAEVERLLREWGSVLFRRAEARGDIPRDAGRRVNSAAQAVRGMRTTQEVVG